MISYLRVWRQASVISFADFLALYPPHLYAIAWLPRLFFQVAFYALLAQFLGGPTLLAFALVGTVAQSTYQTVLTFATASVTWEQRAGTIPLLFAAPSDSFIVFAGRNVAMGIHGVVSGIATLAVIQLLIGGIGIGSAIVIALLLIQIAVSTYAVAILIGSVALRLPGFHNVLASIVGTVITLIGGVYVPSTAWPSWVQVMAWFLPVTNGLAAVRSVVSTAPADETLEHVLVEGALAVAYFGLARISFALFRDRAIGAGTLDFN